MSPHLFHALTLLSMNRPKEAEQAARQHLAGDMDDPVAWQVLARTLTEQRKHRQAIDAARQSVTLDPEDGDAHFMLARVLMEAGKFREARVSIQAAIAIDPEDANHHGLLARVEMEDERYREAADAAARGLGHDPENELCRFYLGMAKSRLGDHEAADSEIARLLASDPEDAENHVARGFALLARGSHAEAKRHFLEALRIDAENEGAREGLVQALKFRSFLYGVFMRMMLYVSRFGSKGFWGLGLLFLLAPQALKWGRGYPWLYVVCSLGLVFLWAAMMLIVAHQPLTTLGLLLDREGRHAVPQNERKAALWCLPVLAFAVAAIVFWLWRTPTAFPRFAFLLLVSCGLIVETYETVSPWVRKRMAAITIGFFMLLGATWGFEAYATLRLAAHVRDVIVSEPPNTSGLSREERTKAIVGKLEDSVTSDYSRWRKWVIQSQLALLIVAVFHDNIRAALERRAPDPD